MSSSHAIAHRGFPPKTLFPEDVDSARVDAQREADKLQGTSMLPRWRRGERTVQAIL